MTWTVEEARRCLRVSKKTIYRMIIRGDLKYEKVGKKYMIIPIVVEHQLTTKALAESTGYSRQHVRRLLRRTSSGRKVGSAKNSHYRISLSESVSLMLCRFGTANVDKQ